MGNALRGLRKNLSLYLLVLFFLALSALGAFSVVQIQLKGQQVLGSSDQIPWNMLIAGYVFMALAASGLCLSANFFEILNIKRFQLLQKRAHFLAISLLVPSLGMLAMELGRFDRVYHFILNPGFSSPIWWMGTVYGIYLLFLFVEFVAIHRGYARTAFVFSIVTLITAVAATSILGGIFAIILDHTLWFGSGTPIWFVFSSVISGIAAMITVTILTYNLGGKVMGEDLNQALRELGTILTVLLGIGLVFTVWRLIASFYVKVPDTFFIIAFPYGFQFWFLFLIVGVISPFLLLLTRTKKNSFLQLAGILVLIGMYVDKHIFVIAGQLRQSIDGSIANYTSTFHEWSLLMGTLAVAALIYMVGGKYLYLSATVAQPHRKAPEPIKPQKPKKQFLQEKPVPVTD